jgi:hypothetical protein
VTTKRQRFHKEVERLKKYYRQWPTDKLRELDKQGARTLKANIAAVREVLKERDTDPLPAVLERNGT